MSTIEITSKIEALKELEALIEEAKAEAETLRDEIKTEMLNRNTEEMEAGQYIVRWTPVVWTVTNSCFWLVRYFGGGICPPTIPKVRITNVLRT